MLLYPPPQEGKNGIVKNYNALYTKPNFFI